MTVVVEMHDRIADPAAWNRVVAESGAPVFYRASVLAAYQAAPLQPTLDVRYLTAVADGRCVAVLPLYHVPSRDPFGAESDRPARTWAISHFWHCYDTRLPAVVPDAGVAQEMWAAVARQAAAWGAERATLVNVARADPLAGHLADLGAVERERNPRYRLELGASIALGDYEAALPAAVRQELRRHRRRAARAGADPVVFAPPLPAEVVDRTCELLGETDRRYNPGYYPAESMAHLLRHGGPAVRVLALSQGPALSAVSVSFVDDGVWHNWAIGVDRAAVDGFSPYTVLLAAAVELALAHGCDRIEMGRTNGSWKQRFGARPVELRAWETPVGNGQPA
jgi:CelD/BcsL family acetyltransferase involved in cellulose biosynthesis